MSSLSVIWDAIPISISSMSDSLTASWKEQVLSYLDNNNNNNKNKLAKPTNTVELFSIEDNKDK